MYLTLGGKATWPMNKMNEHLRYRDDLEQVRILADQCRRREKLRKRALASWQQNMHVLLQQAVSLDQQLLASSSPSTSAKQVSPWKPVKPLFIKAQSGSKHGHSKGSSSKQAKQLAAEIADASENAQAKLAHDMALSLQLTRGVADEAAKLHHVKIIRACPGQPRSSNGAVGPSEEAVPSGEVCASNCLLESVVCLSVSVYLLKCFEMRSNSNSLICLL